MAFAVNSVLITVTNNMVRLTSTVKIDAFLAQNFHAEVHASATGKKVTLGKLTKEKVDVEKVRLDKQTAAQSAITAQELEDYLNL